MIELLSLSLIIALILYIIVLSGQLARANRQAVVPDKTLDREVANMLDKGKTTVQAVKHVRDRTGLGLLEAKQYVDRIELNQNR